MKEESSGEATGPSHKYPGKFPSCRAKMLDYAKELEKMRAALIAGTFRRPTWIPKESWEQIIQANYHAPAISRS